MGRSMCMVPVFFKMDQKTHTLSLKSWRALQARKHWIGKALFRNMFISKDEKKQESSWGSPQQNMPCINSKVLTVERFPVLL